MATTSRYKTPSSRPRLHQMGGSHSTREQTRILDADPSDGFDVTATNVLIEDAEIREYLAIDR
jgi:hypothetical protein